MSAPRLAVRRVLAVIALMIVTGLVAAACGSDDDDSDDFARDPAAAADAALDAADAAFDASVTGDGTTSTVAQQNQPNDTTPPTLPGIVVNEYLLAVNECFDRVESLNRGVAGIVTTRLPCDLPHQAQVFSRIEYPAGHVLSWQQVTDESGEVTFDHGRFTDARPGEVLQPEAVA